MDEETIDLIARLGTRVAMIMEDHCDKALSLRGMDREELTQAVKDLGEAVNQMAALLATAKVLLP
ncbi:hypothetical protein [Sphingobium sp. B12D2B]|uniref:hypothetical protein n=1 Tax=Sphingobium sp. B12D2B TaxID=2940577 RepID=UPI002225B6B3|nr:hypothetical protein [Sphingobium sp. B12D2B]MCW2349166.1 malonyl CoA-acyl carrier protein transacylase [Sphingobium sp. B12D2B]